MEYFAKFSLTMSDLTETHVSMSSWATVYKSASPKGSKRFCVLSKRNVLYIFKSQSDSKPNASFCLYDYDLVRKPKPAHSSSLKSSNPNTALKNAFSLGPRSVGYSVTGSYKNPFKGVVELTLQLDSEKLKQSWVSALEQVFSVQTRIPRAVFVRNTLGFQGGSNASNASKFSKTSKSSNPSPRAQPHISAPSTSRADLAADATRLRTVCLLVISVSEAKIEGEAGDLYAMVDLDSVQARTQTIWKTTNPMWAESWELDVVHAQEEARITVWSTKVFDTDTLIGQCVINMSELLDGKQHSGRYPLTPCPLQHYVSGQIRVLMCLDKSKTKILLKVVSGRGMASKDANGLSDPYVKVLLETDGEVLEGNKGKTKIAKKTLNPVWNAFFELSIQRPGAHSTLRLDVFDWDRLSADDSMGYAEVNSSDLIPDVLYDVWLPLRGKRKDAKDAPLDSNSNSNDSNSNSNSKRGEVRLSLKFVQETVLPLKVYHSLLQFMKSTHTAQFCRLMSRCSKEREEIAKTMVRVSLSCDPPFGYELLCALLDYEVGEAMSPDTLFRGNSICSKAMDKFQVQVGTEWLKSTLGPVLADIFATFESGKKSCEIDKWKLPDKEREGPKADAIVAENFSLLMHYVKMAWNAIRESIDTCPMSLRVVYGYLYKIADKKFPGGTVGTTATSGFLFLRLFTPAILGPKLFGLSEVHPSQNVARTLTLVAKVLQNLGNVAEFGQKEAFLLGMNDFLKAEFGNLLMFMKKICVDDEACVKKVEAIDYGIDCALECARLYRLIREYSDVVFADGEEGAGLLKDICGKIKRQQTMYDLRSEDGGGRQSSVMGLGKKGLGAKMTSTVDMAAFRSLQLKK